MCDVLDFVFVFGEECFDGRVFECFFFFEELVD